MFTWKPFADTVLTSYADLPVPCACDALVLFDYSRGLDGFVKCTRCDHEWSAHHLDEQRKELWSGKPTYADNLNAIR